MKSFGLCVFSCLISIGLVVFVVVVVEVEAFPHAQRGEWYQTYSQDHQPHFSPVNPGFPLLNTKSKTREWHTNYASSGNSVLTKRQSAVSLNPLEMVSNKLRELGQQVVKGFSKLTRFDTRDQDSFSRDFLQPSIDSDSDDYLFVPAASDHSHGSQTYSSPGSGSPGSYFNDGDARSSAHNEIPPSSYHYYTPSSASSSDSGSFSLPSDERVQLTSASTSDHYSSSPSEAFFVDHPTRHVVSHQPQSSGGKPSFFEYVANDLKKAGDWMMGMLGMETYPDEAHDGHKDRLIIDQNMANGQHPYLTDFPESPFADLLYEEYLASSGASTQAPFYPNAEFSHSQGQGEYIAEPATAATPAATKPPVPIKLLISAQVAQEHADEVRTLPIEVVAGSDTTRLVLELPASHTKDLHSPTLIKTTGGRDGASIGVEALTTNGNEYKTTIEAKKANGLQSKVDSDYDDIILVSTEEHDNNVEDENAIIQREDKTFMRVYDKTLGRSILREMNNIYRPVARPSLTKDFFYQASEQTTQKSETQTSGPNPNPPIFESEIDEDQNNVALTSQDADSVDLGQIATSQVIIESDKSDDTALYIVQAPGDIDYEFLLPELSDNEDDYNHSELDHNNDQEGGSSSNQPGDLTEGEAAVVGRVKWSVYWTYIKSCQKFRFLSVFVMYGMISALMVSSAYWLSLLADTNQSDPQEAGRNTTYFLGIYGTFGVAQLTLEFLSEFLYFLGCARASQVIHEKLLQRVFRSPMSFFDTNPTGRIINRFSSDVDVVDQSIPQGLSDAMWSIFDTLSILVVICMSTPSFGYLIVPLFLMYYFIQQMFISTSRQVKRLESLSKSPIYSNLSETVTGMTSIRACKEQTRFIQDSEERVQKWANSIFAVLARSNLSPGLAGLSITYALSIMAELNWLIRMLCELETNSVALERIIEYTNNKQEADWQLPNDPEHITANWPKQGNVEFDSLSVRYRDGLDLVLKNISMEIQGREKVGICGRTGAGKSSFTLSLFRILEADQGQIRIDGQDISKLGLHALRSRITIIPQDPVLFTGDLRFNLDPTGLHPDSNLWSALEHAHLKSHITLLKDGLDHEINEGGENFSVGQRQLICLARALLRKTKILIMDEATAAVDLATDDLIQATIRREFKDCTVITIAHRLNTIMDCDRIAVFSHGKIAEYASPSDLLSIDDSALSSMAKDAGL